ncbi:hypothetical protein [Bacteroides congonensis]|uniref:hypothetical protein n=1 Tax=Bacteroides congonensis TaxID=1871006 RepID=UPI0025A43086|nr:hypothetical protein [Bacteroides congonensis]
MTVKEFLILSDVSSSHEDITSQMENLPRPVKVGDMPTPDTLNDLTFGQLIKLQSIATTMDVILSPCRELLGLVDEEIMICDAEQVLGFSMWTAKEVERINNLFASTSVSPTSEELRAGINQMQFGMFGLIDYFATRMGITNHEQVESVPWVRIYKCLDIDAKRYVFQRRLRKILSEEK